MKLLVLFTIFISSYSYAQLIPQYLRVIDPSTVAEIQTELPIDTYTFVLKNFAPMKTEKIIGIKIDLKLEINGHIQLDQTEFFNAISNFFLLHYFNDGGIKLDMNKEHVFNDFTPYSVKYDYGDTSHQCSLSSLPISHEITWTDIDSGLTKSIILSGTVQSCHNNFETQEKEIHFVDKRGDKLNGEYTTFELTNKRGSILRIEFEPERLSSEIKFFF